MNSRLWELAEHLASRNYDVEYTTEQLADGSKVYIATNPDLDGCRGFGETIDQALAMLDEVRIDYIYSLLEMKREIPAPSGTIQDSLDASGSPSFTIRYFDMQTEGAINIAVTDPDFGPHQEDSSQTSVMVQMRPDGTPVRHAS